MSEDSNKNKSGDTNISESSISSSSITSSSKPAAANSPSTNISSSTPVTKASPSTPPSKPPAPTSLAKKEPEPPLFEKELVNQISSQLGDKVKVSYIRPLRIKIYVDPANIVEVASFLRDSMAFDHAESVAGM